MKRRLSAIISVVLLVALALTTGALAYTVPDGTVVYVTPTGEKYHREDCSYTTTVRPLTIEEAERKGYDPCSRCDPDRLTGEYQPNSSGNKSSTIKSSAGGSSSGSKVSITEDVRVSAVKQEPKKAPPIGEILIACVVVAFWLGPLLWELGVSIVDGIRKAFKKK